MYLPLRGAVGPMRTDFDIDLRAVSKAKLGQPLRLDRVKSFIMRQRHPCRQSDISPVELR